MLGRSAPEYYEMMTNAMVAYYDQGFTGVIDRNTEDLARTVTQKVYFDVSKQSYSYHLTDPTRVRDTNGITTFDPETGEDKKIQGSDNIHCVERLLESAQAAAFPELIQLNQSLREKIAQKQMLSVSDITTYFQAYIDAACNALDRILQNPKIQILKEQPGGEVFLREFAARFLNNFLLAAAADLDAQKLPLDDTALVSVKNAITTTIARDTQVTSPDNAAHEVRESASAALASVFTPCFTQAEAGKKQKHFKDNLSIDHLLKQTLSDGYTNGYLFNAIAAQIGQYYTDGSSSQILTPPTITWSDAGNENPGPELSRIMQAVLQDPQHQAVLATLDSNTQLSYIKQVIRASAAQNSDVDQSLINKQLSHLTFQQWQFRTNLLQYCQKSATTKPLQQTLTDLAQIDDTPFLEKLHSIGESHQTRSEKPGITSRRYHNPHGKRQQLYRALADLKWANAENAEVLLAKVNAIASGKPQALSAGAYELALAEGFSKVIAKGEVIDADSFKKANPSFDQCFRLADGKTVVFENVENHCRQKAFGVEISENTRNAMTDFLNTSEISYEPLVNPKELMAKFHRMHHDPFLSPSQEATSNDLSNEESTSPLLDIKTALAEFQRYSDPPPPSESADATDGTAAQIYDKTTFEIGDDDTNGTGKATSDSSSQTLPGALAKLHTYLSHQNFSSIGHTDHKPDGVQKMLKILESPVYDAAQKKTMIEAIAEEKAKKIHGMVRKFRSSATVALYQDLNQKGLEGSVKDLRTVTQPQQSAQDLRLG